MYMCINPLVCVFTVHRVKDIENRETTIKPLRAIKQKRKYFPKKVGHLGLIIMYRQNQYYVFHSTVLARY